MINMDNYEQQSIFGFPKYKITKKIRLIEMFGGIGSQAMAMRDIGADFEHYRLIEFDKYCVQSYNAIHHTNFEPTDIRDVHGKELAIKEKEKYCYILTYSFPCTDLSVAGKMKGMSKADWKNGESTRSGLLWEVERILKELPKEELPDVLLMENVPQVHSDQNAEDFMSWQDFLNSLGYFNFIKDLNAKDYGIPQNRERCFMVSILSDDFIDFEFPKPIELKTVMKDYLEEKVDEKYYINSEKADRLIEQLIESGVLAEQNRTEQNRTEYSPLICVSSHQEQVKLQTASRQDMMQESATYKQTEVELSKKQDKRIAGIDLCVKNPKERQVANCITALYNNHGICNHAQEGNGVIEYVGNYRRSAPQGYSGSVYKTSGISPCCKARDYKEPIMIVDEYEKGKKTAILPCVENKIIRVGQISNEGSQCGTVVATEGLYPTVSAGTHGYANPHIVSKARIRKLTPKECWRLMGYTDEDFDNAKASGVSNSQLYKQAGNAIVKQVLMAIFKQML